MKRLKTILPILLIIAAFFAGQFTTPDNTEILEKKFEQERQQSQDSISVLLQKLDVLSAESREIKEKMTLDSVKYSEALEQNKQAYNRLKRKYNEINLNRADAYLLDSLVSRLYTE